MSTGVEIAASIFSRRQAEIARLRRLAHGALAEELRGCLYARSVHAAQVTDEVTRRLRLLDDLVES